jgi:hypothetical protein
MDIAHDAGRQARQAHHSEWMDHAIRAGLVAYGVVHLLIGWLALQLAFGDREGSPSSSGAMQQLAEQPFGKVLVWLVAVGMLLLVIWRVLEAVYGHQDEDSSKRTRKRATSAGKAVLYGAISVSALRVATGSGSSGGGKKSGTDSTTAKLMDLPGGQALVVLVGLAVIGYGGYLLVKAWTEKYAKELDAEGKSGETGSAYLMFGKIGYAAKGVAIGIVGGLFVYAGVTHEASRSGGLDQALYEVLDQPFGPALLGIIAVGIGCYGLFAFARAKHLSR